MKLDHIGIAVKSLEESVPIFEKIFGVKASAVEYVPEQQVKVQKLKIANCDIELLEGTSDDSPIRKHIEKRGEGIQHCSFEVSDINEALFQYKKEGIKLINDEARVGADNKLIAFLHPKSTAGVLIEISQSQT
ncbi:MAG: methylmalonyl-CoA epimerase [Ignavibacteria bacterium]